MPVAPMGMTGWVAVGVALLYLAVTTAKVRLAMAWLCRTEPEGDPPAGPSPSGDGPVTVLQAIRSGDPRLPELLRENLANHPGDRFLWLVDADDPAALDHCRQLQAEVRRGAATREASAAVELLIAPPLPPGRNPKVFKLALALPSCGPVVAVLDDDTVLPPGALARARRELVRGDLVTGIPRYRPGTGLLEGLVAAFVNGNALLTYLPVLRFAPPVTINGMFYLTRRDTLESLGGFAAIEERLCDDYELARLYRRGGRTLAQSGIVHPLTTTVTGLGGYLRLMRRWMVFATHLLRSEATVPVLALVVLPSLLPLVAVLLAAASGSVVAGAAVLAALTAKALLTRTLRHRVGGGVAAAAAREPARMVALEVAAELLTPLHTAAALVLPRRVRWRDRQLRSRGGRIEAGSG